MNQDVVNIIKYSIYGGEVPVISDWDAAAKMLIDHAVVPILWTGNRIAALNIPETVMNMLKKYSLIQLRNYIRICSAVGELTGTLGEQGIAPVILKGMAAAVYHREPGLRTTGDIDFLVRNINTGNNENETFERAGTSLAANGYIFTEEEKDPDIAYMRHDAITKNGVSYEMHRFFSTGRDELDARLDRIISEAEPVLREVDGCKFYMLPDDVNGLVLIEHIHHHLKSGLGLRQIIDWLCYVEKVLTDDVWDSGFGRMASETGLEALAVNVTGMCEMYLGLSHRKFAESADERTCEILMEEILGAGNFGKCRSDVVNHIAGFANSVNVFARLQEGGLCRWEAAKKHRFLRPFAWIYQFFRIIGVITGNFISGRSIKGAGELTNRQDELFRTLKIGKYR